MGGYLYLRFHSSYRGEQNGENFDLLKFGFTKSIKNRNNLYKTCEVIPGSFVWIAEIKNWKVKKLEKKMKSHFTKKGLHRYFGGGTEFFDKSIHLHIEPYLTFHHVDFHILSQREIDGLQYEKYDHIYSTSASTSEGEGGEGGGEGGEGEEEVKVNSILPLPHQMDILERIENYYETHDKGKIIWACGLGKALLSLFITQKMGFRRIVIGVPSVYLQKQMKSEILRVFDAKSVSILFIGGNEEKSFKVIEKIKEFRHGIESILFVITTYASSHYLANDHDISFDFKIGDEAHHLVSYDQDSDSGSQSQSVNRKYIAFHHIRSKYSLFMTATPKNIEEKSEQDDEYNVYSMNDEDHFGSVIDVKSISWAIEHKKITDYYLHVLYNSEAEVNKIIFDLGIQVHNKELFIAAYMTLKSMEKHRDLTHVLIYCNSIENATLTNQYVKIILEKRVIQLDDMDMFYLNDLHSKRTNICLECQRSEMCQCEVCKFSKSKYGIISSVFIFGEGFDLPRLNGVCFAENMTSEIRIVQSALRPNRVDRKNPHKMAYMILPYIDDRNIGDLGKNSFEKCRKIIYEMRNHDAEIERKVRLMKLENEGGGSGESGSRGGESGGGTIRISLSENCEELLNIFKMRLRHSRALPGGISPEEDEYQVVRAMNRLLKVDSIDDYHQKRDIHMNYIKDPEIYFKSVWRRRSGWYDFFGMDLSGFIQDKYEWIQFCKKHQIQSVDEYKEKCNEHKELPKHPEHFYESYTNMIAELELRSIQRRR